MASYVPWVRTGNLVYVSGQIPRVEGQMVCVGRVPDEVAPTKAKTAARVCALNMLAAVNEAVGGDLDKVVRVVRLGVFVHCAPGFFEQPEIGNGASDLMVEVFGEAGRHARAAVGSVALPLGSTVEVEGVFEVRS